MKGNGLLIFAVIAVVLGAYSHLPLSKKSFLDYVNSIISEETKSYSCYELGLDNQQLFQSELDDVYTSVVNLNSLA